MLKIDELKESKNGKTIRKTFSKIAEAQCELPYFVDLQKSSYEKFIKEGIADVLKDFSPICSTNQDIKLYLENPVFDQEGKYDIKECKNREATYSKGLRITGRLHIKGQHISENPIYLCSMPMMTESGSFVINGSEKVVVSQLLKSAGVLFDKTIDKSGEVLYKAKIMPYVGSWIEFYLNPTKKDGDVVKYGEITCDIDKVTKTTATVLLRTLGIGKEYLGLDDDITEVFGDDPIIAASIEKDIAKKTNDATSARLEMYKKIKTVVQDQPDKIRETVLACFTKVDRFDFAPHGRYKMNKKLALSYRLVKDGVALDEDEAILLAENLEVTNPETGEVTIFEAGKSLSKVEAEFIQNSGINSVLVKIRTVDGEKIIKVIGNNTVKAKYYLPEEILNNNHFDLDGDDYIYYPAVLAMLEERANNEEISWEESLAKYYGELIQRPLNLDDVIATVNYTIGLKYGIGQTDVIDHLGNRRVNAVGDSLKDTLRKGMANFVKGVRDKFNSVKANDVTADELIKGINNKPIDSEFKKFFNQSQLTQSMEQINPIAALTHKRKLTALGPRGLTKERAGFEVRDINYTHYGRMCPIETPEGQNIGLITSLSTYAKVNKYGFLITPYRKVVDGIVTNDIEYLDADDEDKYIVAQANEALIEKDGKLIFANANVTCRYKDEIRQYEASTVTHMDVSPKQLISVSASLIPFLEHDDTTRALMGSNMQKQAVPLLKTERAIVATGMEYRVARDSGATKIAKYDGKVTYVDANKILIARADNDDIVDEYILTKYEKSNASTCINQKPIVSNGDEIKAGDTIADGFATKEGELALGKNALVAFMEWEGYNYEDAVLLNEDLVKNDTFTSIHIDEYEVSRRDVVQLGPETITKDIPNESADKLKDLDDDGIIRIGAVVKENDILVGKITPKGETEPDPTQKLFRAICTDKGRDVKNSSLKMPHGEYGVVVDVKRFDKKQLEDKSEGVLEKIRVYIAQKRKISVGDKMAGRHGNKGVVSKILPREDMPFMKDGTPIQILLNPLGVPSRMNVGQLLEVHLGLAAKRLNYYVETPVFDSVDDEKIAELIKQSITSPSNHGDDSGKVQLYDGRTGDPFDNKVTVGYMYYLKLDHLVDDKIHARSTGSYSTITKQPLGGKAQFGGQRFGEMEVWAIEAYGAAYVLQEMLTIKSDDVSGRNEAYRNIQTNKNVDPAKGVPEAFRVLCKELQALCLDIHPLTEDHKKIEISERDDDFVDVPLADEEPTEVVSIFDLENKEFETEKNPFDLFDNISEQETVDSMDFDFFSVLDSEDGNRD